VHSEPTGNLSIADQ